MKKVILIVLEGDSPEKVEEAAGDIYDHVTALIEKEQPAEEAFFKTKPTGFIIKNYFKDYKIQMKVT